MRSARSWWRPADASRSARCRRWSPRFRSELCGTPLDYTDEALARILSARHFVNVRETLGGPAPAETARASNAARQQLDDDRAWWQRRRRIAAIGRAATRRTERKPVTRLYVGALGARSRDPHGVVAIRPSVLMSLAVAQRLNTRTTEAPEEHEEFEGSVRERCDRLWSEVVTWLANSQMLLILR